MANLETEILDDIIVKSRRKLLTLGGTALAGMFVGGAATTASAATYSDADILNFALNLEYLEANFYYISAFGCTIDKVNSAAIAAGAPSGSIPINVGVGTAGGTAVCSVTGPVPFTTVTAASYARETAIEEGKHVLFLQAALGAATQVAQPAINLDIVSGGAWATLVAAANANNPSSNTAGVIPTGFSPYASDTAFLVGAYVFEDVGVTAYHGAASLLTVSGNLSAAGGILAVEAYHAGLVRTSINALDPTQTAGPVAYTTSISNLRAILANAASAGSGSTVGGINYDTNPDDFGLANFSVNLAGTTGFTAAPSSRITDADTSDSSTQNPLPLAIAFSRNTNQVLNIVTGGGKFSGTTVNPIAKGVFFPSGMNAGANGFK